MTTDAIQERDLGAGPRVIAGLAIALLASIFIATGPSHGMGTLAIGFCITWIGLLFTVWSPKRGLVEGRGVYLIVFGLFHGGLVIATALIGEEAFLNRFESGWITARNLEPAVTIVCFAMIAFTVGALCAPQIKLPLRAADGASIETRLTVAGAALLVAAILLLMPVVIGDNIFTLSYDQIFALGTGRGFAYGLGFLTAGCGLLIAADGKARTAGWAAFVIVALILLPIGFRGPVLFAAAPLVVIEGRRRHFNLLFVLPAAIATLTVASIIRQTRLGGIQALLNPTDVGVAPMQGLAELGYSIKPVVVVQEWMAGGEPPHHGVTLIAPMLRFVERLAGGHPPTPDFRLFNVEILQRAGPIGGSPVAEGLRNGGPLFVLCFMAAIGLVIGILDRLPDTTLGSAIIVMTLTPLMASVRNDFAPVPARWIVGVIVIGLILLWPPPRQAQEP
ncbi:hypothetical protein J2X11_000764 [Aeromicrobium panaciterrae]|uniref:O-antigen polysaccharide polymerase Wzy n=1 Tax=Aeromicrobium panaciterrae TaxID=363861 RepID=A0ABU1UL96_9ACTN|nr:hypothetical protein [Aeromicrobium panaciterrae]MDR7085925.1 hypothetical protein [Aeromicrobium panaciterrae]